MDKLIVISLSGRPDPFRLQEDAYEALDRYLEGARSRLAHDPDQAEVIGDLERSIGDKLADRVGADDRILMVADIEAVLDEVGSVGTGDDEPIAATAPAPARRRVGQRRLCRIREGEQLAGVCTGLAAYTDIRVDWVRAIFVLATIFTAGMFLIVYLVMAFVLPVLPTQEAWTAMQNPVGD